MNRQQMTAFTIARRILALIRHKFTDLEAGDAFASFYRLADEGIEELLDARERRQGQRCQVAKRGSD